VASKSDLEAVIKLAGNIDPSLKRALLDAQRRIGDVGKTSSMTGKLISSAFSFAAKGAVIGATAIGAGLLLIAKQGLDLASDLTEVQNVVDVTFGKGATQINEWSKQALQAYGLSELSAKQYSSTLGALMKSSGVSSENLIGMSENLAALSGDFASFYNLDPAEAFEKIKSGISGETEPLKALGINMSVANMEAFALAHGIKTSWDKMSQGDQVMLRYNYLLEKSADAQGDFARTQGTYANQQRLFKESFKQVSSTIMTAALPAFTSLFKKGNELISAFANSPDKVKKLQDTIAGVADKVILFIPIAISYVGDFIGILGQLYTGAEQVYHFISDNWSLIGPIIYGVVAAIVAWKIAMGIISLVKTFATVIKGLKIAFDFLRISKIKDAATTLYLQGLYAKDAIIRGASTIATWAMTAAGAAWNIMATIGAGVTWAFGAAVAFLISPIGLIILAIVALIAVAVLLYKNWDSVSAFLANSWDAIKNGFAVGINFIVDKINWLIDKMNLIPGVNIPLIPKMDTSAINAATNSIPTHGMMMQEFARGGFANQASIFGEAGPEAAIPLKRTPRSLSLLSKTASALGVDGGGGSPQFVFAPVIGGSGNSMKEDLKSAADDFFSQADRWWESKRRESFG
jgi:hypothetical protein